MQPSNNDLMASKGQLTMASGTQSLLYSIMSKEESYLQRWSLLCVVLD